MLPADQRARFIIVIVMLFVNRKIEKNCNFFDFLHKSDGVVDSAADEEGNKCVEYIDYGIYGDKQCCQGSNCRCAVYSKKILLCGEGSFIKDTDTVLAEFYRAVILAGGHTGQSGENTNEYADGAVNEYTRFGGRVGHEIQCKCHQTVCDHNTKESALIDIVYQIIHDNGGDKHIYQLHTENVVVQKQSATDCNNTEQSHQRCGVDDLGADKGVLFDRNDQPHEASGKCNTGSAEDDFADQISSLCSGDIIKQFVQISQCPQQNCTCCKQ